jgi:hypothetical protein
MKYLVLAVALFSAGLAADDAVQEADDLRAAIDAMQEEEAAWSREHEAVYYECFDESDKLTLEVFQGLPAGYRLAGMKIKPAFYFESGLLKTFLFVDVNREPLGGGLVMRIDGLTTYHETDEGDSSWSWICKPAPWPEAQ